MTMVMSSPLAGRGDDDLLRAGGEVALGLLAVGEQAGGFDHVVDAQLLPRQLGGRLRADDRDLLAVDDQHVVGFLVGARLLRADRAVELGWVESYFSRYARLSAGTMSPTATTSMSLPSRPCSTRARKTRRPMRPNPLIAIRVLISISRRQALMCAGAHFI